MFQALETVQTIAIAQMRVDTVWFGVAETPSSDHRREPDLGVTFLLEAIHIAGRQTAIQC